MKYKARFEMDPGIRRALAASPRIVQAELTTALREIVQHVAGEAEHRAPRRRGVLAGSIHGEVSGQRGVVGSSDYRAGWLEEGVTILPMGKRSRGKALAIPQTEAARRLQKGLRASRSLRGIPGLFVAAKGGGRAVLVSRDDPGLRWTLVPVVRIRARRYLQGALEASEHVMQREVEAAGLRVINRVFGGVFGGGQ